MRLFAHAPVAVDLRFAAGHGAEVRAAVATHERVAVLAVVTKRSRPVQPDAGRRRTARAGERAPAGWNRPRGTPVSLPVAEGPTRRSSGRWERGQDSDDGRGRRPHRRAGMSGADAQALRVSGGQQAFAVRRVRRHGPGPRRACDTGATGRCRRSTCAAAGPRSTTRGTYLVASPADQNTLARLVGLLRDARVGAPLRIDHAVGSSQLGSGTLGDRPG